MTTLPKQTEPPPLARMIPISELAGQLNKTLDVPPGRVGIALGPDGAARTFGAGQQRVVSLGARLRGDSARTVLGYYTPGPFNAMLEAAYLLSGDEVLLDASLFAAVEVADPARYFTEQVIPLGEVRQAVVNLSDGPVQKALAAVTRCYAADDLIRGLPTGRLAAEIRPGLAGALENQGLRLVTVQVISFWRSDERVCIAEGVQAIDEKLQGLVLDRQMAEQERQLAAEEFTREIESELGPGANVRVVIDPGAKPTGASAAVGAAAAQSADPLAGVRGWALARKAQPGSGSNAVPRRWALMGLFKKSPQAQAEKQQLRRPPRRWWLPGLLWILFLLALGCGATRGLLLLDKRLSAEMIYGTIISVWFVVAPLVLDGLKKLLEKSEKIADATWVLPGATRLDQLVGRDRVRADQLVREQCRAEVGRAADLLDGLVSRAYKAGNTRQALGLRRVRQQFSEAAEKLISSEFGSPAYLTNIRLGETAWDRMLDYDEDLLLYANALADKTMALQQSWLQPGGSDVESEAGLAEVERHLADLLYRFSGRARVLRA